MRGANPWGGEAIERESEGMGKREGGEKEKNGIRRVYGSWLLPQPLNESALVGITTNKIGKSGVSHTLFLFIKDGRESGNEYNKYDR